MIARRALTLLVVPLVACTAEQETSAPDALPSRSLGAAEPQAVARLTARLAGPEVDRKRRAAVELSPRADVPMRITDPRSGVAVSVALAGAAHEIDAAPLPEGSGRVFHGVLPGSAWVQRVAGSGAEDFVAFEERPSRASVRYEVALDRVAHVRLVSNTLEFLDEEGAPRLRVPPPRILPLAGACAHSSCPSLPATIDVSGCTIDRDPRAPWGRPLPAPGSATCLVDVVWDDAALAYPAALDPSWTLTNHMTYARLEHTATLLPSGDVLVAGGSGFDLDVGTSAEIYHPPSDAFAMADAMPTSMFRHAATVRADGSVLLVGGNAPSTTVIFDGTTFVFGTSPLVSGHANPSVLRLKDDRLFLAGSSDSSTFSTEIYDPPTDEWLPIPNPSDPLWINTVRPQLVELEDGRVFMFGCATAESALLDPVSKTWVSAGPPPTQRCGARVVRLLDGRVAVTGGRGSDEKWQLAIDLFTPAAAPGTGAWTSVSPSGGFPRSDHGLGILPNGAVLLVSGMSESYGTLADVRIFDPATSAYTLAPSLTEPRKEFAFTALADGKWMVVGGSGMFGPLDTAEILEFDMPGTTCTVGSTCVSGFCADGVCCDSACDGACESCLAAQTGGTTGTCADVVADTPDAACPDEGPASCGTTGKCARGGVCALRDAGTPCGVSACVAGTFTSVACDGVGACVATPQACAPFVCADGAGCATTCADDASCAPGFDCVDGACLPKTPTGAPCTDDEACAVGLCGDDGTCGSPKCIGVATLRLVSGDTEDCAPYVCRAGACLARCASVLDCTLGDVCNADGVCAEPSPPIVDEGCALASAADPPASAPLGLWMTVALATAIRRRARTSGPGRSR